MIELCFVYNARSGIAHGLMDYVHKIVSPDTYACSLCGVTYGHLGMRRGWANYLRGLPFAIRFFYQDTLPQQAGSVALPAAFVVRDGDWEQVVTAEEMNAATTVELLVSLCDQKLAPYTASSTASSTGR